MKSRKTKIENADTPSMVKPGKRSLSNTPSCDAKIKNGWPARLGFIRNGLIDRPVMTSFKFNFTLSHLFSVCGDETHEKTQEDARLQDPFAFELDSADRIAA
jgi:hypothetical protein